MFKYNHLIKVYYRDVDQMGIVYYTRYLEYFEEARTELLDSLGLTISLIEDRGIQLPVIASHCDYKKGAKLEDKLVIEASIAEIPKVKLNINYNIFAGDHCRYWLVPHETTVSFNSNRILYTR